MASLDELLAPGNSVWLDVSARIEAAAVPSSIVPNEDFESQTLEALQVTTGSTLGAIVYNTGGLLIDNGWVRIHGAGSKKLPAVGADSPGCVVVGHDVIGGRFALNGGALGGEPGEVNYWAPDKLEWDALGLGYTDFVHAFLGGATTSFYELFRWENWAADVAPLDLDQGIALYPPPFTKEGADIKSVQRATVPLDELHALYADYAAQLNGG